MANQLTNWNSFFDDLNRYEDLFFPSRYNSMLRNGRRGVRPNMKLDMRENEHEYVLVADIPGVDKSKINVNYDNNILTITADRSEEKKEDGDHFHYLERSFGSYSRSVSLPKNIDYENMKATYRDGVLNINVPKTTGSNSRTLKIE